MIPVRPTVLALLFASASVLSLPTPVRREVPQEHSHNFILDGVRESLGSGPEDNPFGIKDPVFGVLGNANGAQGLGSFTDVECLQQATADQAFTNAKKKGDVKGQVFALLYRALERNTPTVGTKSNQCTSFQAVNPEIAAIHQHQDPGSPNANESNKAVVLELARQIKSVGGFPQDALLTGTFAPSTAAESPNGKGNSCDGNDCIFQNNLLVDDATPQEIVDAVGGGGNASNSVDPGATDDGNDTD